MSNKKTYKNLAKDPLETFKSELKTLLGKANRDKVINLRGYQFLYKELYKHPYFYHLPKVHKDPICPPGRPIIVAMASFTSGLSQYVDYFLQPIVQSLPSYIRDPSHLLDTYPITHGKILILGFPLLSLHSIHPSCKKL